MDIVLDKNHAKFELNRSKHSRDINKNLIKQNGGYLKNGVFKKTIILHFYFILIYLPKFCFVILGNFV
jgi:hypothetical protein